MEIIIREIKESDITTCIDLFKSTVHIINAKDYTEDQLHAWAPEDVDFNKWKVGLLSSCTYVAELKNGKIVGFGDITKQGYLDHLFVHKDFQGKGIAKILLKELENKAIDVGCYELTTHASITAKPFFISQGYKVLKKQTVAIRGQILENFIMIKSLDLLLQ